ncbi:hypothetical protein J2046_002598 [Rhizobium petrolearium]|uniref:hypothetical protein n=1 Tax=Neorhizobium petrolearium TaxID=515361 RepID=UPI001F31FA55|nr:hypothetical protein [Neorhizobium petrolearium]MBP1844339.1 hypothetical protein [Neorhizobium petrolearium]
MRQVHYAWLRALPEASSVEVIQQIFAWVFPKQRPSLEGDLAASAVEKLLNPWLRSHLPADVGTFLFTASLKLSAIREINVLSFGHWSLPPIAKWSSAG